MMRPRTLWRRADGTNAGGGSDGAGISSNGGGGDIDTPSGSTGIARGNKKAELVEPTGAFPATAMVLGAGSVLSSPGGSPGPLAPSSSGRSAAVALEKQSMYPIVEPMLFMEALTVRPMLVTPRVL